MKAFKNTRLQNIFQSSLQTELSPKITVHYSVNYDVWQCNVLEYNVAITNLSDAIFPTLEKLLESLSSSFLFCSLAGN